MSDEEGDSTSSPITLTSIARGYVNSGDDGGPSRWQLSQSDFRSLLGRIEALENERSSEARGSALFRDDEKKPPTAAPTLAQDSHAEEENESNEPDERRRLTESEIEALHDEYELPESTFTLLMTENVLSIPFATGILAAGLAFTCLYLAWKNEIDNGEPGNPLGMPAGVQTAVRVAQYMGVIIGVLMEDEIPQGLELIGKGAEQAVSGKQRFSMARVVLPALLRMVIGYMFLMCLFLVVVQEETVLDIFFDILALEFVENIDDAIFGLCQRGFFGRRLRVATNNIPAIHTTRESHKLRRWMKRLIRIVYLSNILAGFAALTYFVITQENGEYRCQYFTVSFGDDMWEDAWITSDPFNSSVSEKSPQKRLLIFSHFNGVYKEAEHLKHDGRPVYVEQNKEDGDPFQRTVPAEIIYCGDIESWVFHHPHIKTSIEEKEENECSWLLRSPTTDSYDLIQLAEETEWLIWKGLQESEYRISIECNECDSDADCNYNGICSDDKCDCNDEHFGTFCSFERPCDVIRSEKDNATTLTLLGDPNDDEVDFVEVYKRPMYKIENLSGKPFGLLRLEFPGDGPEYFDVEYPEGAGANGTGELPPHKHYEADFFEDDDFFEENNATEGFQQLLTNYTFVLRFTGRRWYGQIVPPGISGASFKEEEYHAFWNNAFSGLGQQDNSTLLISAPTAGGSPVGVDFYEMRRRNIAFETGIHDYDYSPFGVLIPLVEYEGSGFFHCNKPE